MTESPYQVGDKIEFTNKGYSEWVGMLGTVTEVPNHRSVRVRYDGGTVLRHYSVGEVLLLMNSYLSLAFTTQEDILNDYSID